MVVVQQHDGESPSVDKHKGSGMHAHPRAASLRQDSGGSMHAESEHDIFSYDLYSYGLYLKKEGRIFAPGLGQVYARIDADAHAHF